MPRIASHLALAVALALGQAECTRASGTPRPSILLFLFDTTRADAVSAYGHVAGTTPTTDALAAEGLRYVHAYSQAPWTLPSHATLFTGLLPSQHGVTWSRLRAPDGLVTLAERLRDAGYQTAGMSENPWISREFNMTQGFERFRFVGARHVDVGKTLEALLSGWQPDRPFFLFVNVMDAHKPYAIREENPFVPPSATLPAGSKSSLNPNAYLCAAAGHQHELEILRGLYHGDVRAADVKLRTVLEGLQNRNLDRNLVTIVTADHGEHFGEHNLVDHAFSVNDVVLRVPLVVHGLSGVERAVIDTPVQLADIVPTVLGWTQVAVPEDLPGQPLPTKPDKPSPPRTIIAELTDPVTVPEKTQVSRRAANLLKLWRAYQCTRDDKVHGEMRALMRHPFKLVWFERYPSELYDLREDGEEQHDLATERPDLMAELGQELERRMLSMTSPRGSESTDRSKMTGDRPGPSAEILDRLRILGYIEKHDPEDTEDQRRMIQSTPRSTLSEE